MLAETSHELRAPLNVISLYLGALQRDSHTNSEQHALLQTMQAHLRIAARIVDDLQDAVRMQHRRLSVTLAPTNLHALIHEALEGFRAELAESALTLELDLAATLHEVSGDSDRLLQVLWNLLRNAIKFTPRGGAIQIRTLNEEAPELGGGAFVVLEIRDNGVGLDGRELERIFLPFHQAAPSAEPPSATGLGLGLPLSRHIAELHGGTLTAQSPGVSLGSILTLRIPVIPNR